MNRMRLIIPLVFMFSLQLMKSNAAEENESYDDRYCTTCHGADGRGNYGVQAPRLAGMEPWYLRRQLENFRAELRGVHPRDIEGVAMQPMTAKLTDESIADIIEWVGTGNTGLRKSRLEAMLWWDGSSTMPALPAMGQREKVIKVLGHLL